MFVKYTYLAKHTMRTFFEKFNKLKEKLAPHQWNIRVPEEERNQRLEICNGCEYFKESIKMCSQCGCHIPSKSIFYFSECPQDKWPINNVK